MCSLRTTSAAGSIKTSDLPTNEGDTLNRNPTRRSALRMLSIPLVGGTALNALAQVNAYPSRPIKIIVPWAAGGGGDALVRAMAPVLSQRLGQPVVIDNRPGAIGTIGSLAGGVASENGK